MKKFLKSDLFGELLGGFLALVIVLGFIGGLMLITEAAENKPAVENTYEVVEVNQYVHQVSNRFGGNIRNYVRFSATYIDDEGNVQVQSNLYDSGSDHCRVIIGDENTLTIRKHAGSTTYTLVITEEMLKSAS